MSITITDNNVSVTEPDQSAILVTGTGDTVITNSSTITFNSGSGSALTVNGANDTISLGQYGETLTLAQGDIGATISAFDGAVIQAFGDALDVSFSAAGGDFQHASLDGIGNTVTLNGGSTVGNTFTAIGNHNTVTAEGFGISSISVAGIEDVVNADNIFIGVGGSHTSTGSATINGSGDLINVSGADVSVNGGGNTVFTNDTANISLNGAGNTVYASGAAIVLTDGSSATISGGDNNVTADNAAIAFTGPFSFNTVHGANDTISLGQYGETLTLAQGDIGATISVSDGSLIQATADALNVSFSGDFQHASLDGDANTVTLNANLTVGDSFTVIGRQNTVTANGFGISSISVAGTEDVVNADNTFIGVGTARTSRGSATINGSGDLINVSGADVSVNGGNNTVYANDSAIHLTDGSSATIVGGDNHVTADNAAIAFTGVFSANTVDGANDTISLGQYGETLTLAQSGVVATISAYDGASIHASGDALDVSFSNAGGDFQHASLDGNGNTVTLNANLTVGDSFTVIGNHNTVTANGFGISSISVAGTDEVVNADNTFIGVAGSLSGRGSATINGSGDLINVFGGDVSVNGGNNTVYANDSAIHLTDGSSVTIIGGDNHVTADNAFISLGDSLTSAGSATIDGSGGIISVHGAGVGIGINGFGDTVFASNAEISVTAGSSVTILGGENHVTADNASIGLGPSLTIAGSATIDGNGDIISAHGFSVEIGINGFGDTVFASNAEISLTAGSSATIFGAENHVTADNASIAIRNTLADLGSATVDGNGDTIFANSGGATVTIHGSNDTLIGSDGGDILAASGSNNTVHGGAGNDTFLIQGGTGIFFGGGGSDVFNFEVGGGQAHIANGGANSARPSGELDFAAGVDVDHLWFQQEGNDLSISVLGSHDHVTLDGWFGASRSQLQEIKLSDGLEIDSNISQLVQAMASYSTANVGFDPANATQVPTDGSLQAAIAASWHHA
jgi:hypothetical protein